MININYVLTSSCNNRDHILFHLSSCVKSYQSSYLATSKVTLWLIKIISLLSEKEWGILFTRKWKFAIILWTQDIIEDTIKTCVAHTLKDSEKLFGSIHKAWTYSSPPLSARGMLQDPKWMPETRDNTKTYIYIVFSYTYIAW